MLNRIQLLFTCILLSTHLLAQGEHVASHVSHTVKGIDPMFGVLVANDEISVLVDYTNMEGVKEDGSYYQEFFKKLLVLPRDGEEPVKLQSPKTFGEFELHQDTWVSSNGEMYLVQVGEKSASEARVLCMSRLNPKSGQLDAPEQVAEIASRAAGGKEALDVAVGNNGIAAVISQLPESWEEAPSISVVVLDMDLNTVYKSLCDDRELLQGFVPASVHLGKDRSIVIEGMRASNGNGEQKSGTPALLIIDQEKGPRYLNVSLQPGMSYRGMSLLDNENGDWVIVGTYHRSEDETLGVYSCFLDGETDSIGAITYYAQDEFQPSIDQMIAWNGVESGMRDLIWKGEYNTNLLRTEDGGFVAVGEVAAKFRMKRTSLGAAQKDVHGNEFRPEKTTIQYTVNTRDIDVIRLDEKGKLIWRKVYPRHEVSKSGGSLKEVARHQSVMNIALGTTNWYVGVGRMWSDNMARYDGILKDVVPWVEGGNLHILSLFGASKREPVVHAFSISLGAEPTQPTESVVTLEGHPEGGSGPDNCYLLAAPSYLRTSKELLLLGVKYKGKKPKRGLLAGSAELNLFRFSVL